MTQSDDLATRPNSETEITLGLLRAVEENDRATQRSLSRELGIALGLTNAYLKRCVGKGFIKVRQAPANRYAYYVTPKGFAEKSRLTAQYLAISFNFFRASRQQCSEVFSLCSRRGWRRVILAGTSDLAEIATLCADDHGIELVGIFSPGEEHEMFAGLPVLDRLDNGAPFDAVVITDFQQPQLMLEAVRAHVPEERVHAPELLKISRSTATRSGA